MARRTIVPRAGRPGVMTDRADRPHCAMAAPQDYLLELIGPDRLIDAASMSDAWLYGEDPKRYPFDTGRLRQVVERAASEAGWGRQLPQGRGFGIAAHRSFVSYSAVVVEVAIGAKGEITIPRVDIAFDCGAVVNPDRVRSQL